MLRPFTWVVSGFLLRIVLPFLLFPIHAKAGITIDGRDAAAYVTEQTGAAWAVVIGIDGYQYAPKLRYAVSDAKAVAHALETQGFQTTVLYDAQATRRAIVSELGGKLVKRVSPRDRVLIYYAGHGVEQKVEGGKVMGYLLPVDGEMDDFAGTSISMGLIKELADALPSKHVLFVVDSCYGGIAGQSFRSASLSKTTEDYVRLITRERGRQVITAGGADQEALESPEWGHSVFTHYFLNGIEEGLADLNNDGIIPASELYTYLDSRVYAAAQLKGHTQRPELWSLAAEKGEFVFTHRSKVSRLAGEPASDLKQSAEQTGLADRPGRATTVEQDSRAGAAQYAMRPKVNRLEPKHSGSASAHLSEVLVLDRDPAGCTWVSSTARVPFGEHNTRHQAQAQAISQARAKAMRHFLGIKVQNSFVDFMQANDLKGQAALTDQLLRMTQEGHILKEEIISSRVENGDRCQSCEYEVKLKDCLLPFTDRGDRDFRVSLAMNRSTFLDGDEGIVYVSATKDAYVHIYSIDRDQNASLLFPNDYAKENLIRAERQFIFPSEDLRQKGLKLKARLPAGSASAAEMIKVIATKTPVSPSLLDPAQDDRDRSDASTGKDQPGQGTYFHLVAKLHRAKVSWVEDGQAFTIHEH
ncbi:MAG: caspase family protein [Nitrospira sp.]|nr:caspase family protein [Nitrospira sp.]